MGKIYMNEVKIKNILIQKVNISSYESLIRYCKELREIFPKVDKFIYQDDLNYFEIPRKLLDEKE